MAVPNPNLKIVTATSSEFHAEDAGDDRFLITAWLRGGILTFLVEAELPNGDRGSVSGSEFFDAMMNHFGTAVRTIEGDWSIRSPGLTRNIDEVNQLTAAGLSIEEAALQTWTGRKARQYGYSDLTIDLALPTHAAGNYQHVIARFSKS